VKSVVGFKNLKIHCVIGVNEEERRQEQDIFVELRVVLHHAPRQDDVSTTIDYTALSNICKKVAKKHHYHLLESLAKKILEEIFNCFLLEEGWIKIKKPKAIAGADYAFVEMTKVKNHAMDTGHRGI